MAQVAADKNLSASLQGFGRLNVLRQMGLLVGLAASIAIGVALALWSQEPGFRMLYSGLADKDLLEMTTALESSGIPYKLSEGAGTIMVPGKLVHEARLNLAGQGLPNGTGMGFELLDKEQGFGVSQFMENARYQHALEGELARSIMGLSTIKSARVHLAIPKQTAFLRDRDRKEPSASVMLNLYTGRVIEEGQVASIVHLVASSVPSLSPSKVTVVDQTGKLLSGSDSSRSMQLTATQFDHQRKLEEYYIKRIESILSPIMGTNAVRAQVVTEMDFSVTEQAQESFNPDLPAIRSEQTMEDQSSGATRAAGVPGAVSNQPRGATSEANAGQNGVPQNATRRVTRNYELDRTVSHTQLPTGVVRRLSVAVVIDDRLSADEEGQPIREPRSEEEITRITSLVKEAVGFSAQRGDSVNVINASFAIPPEMEPLPEPGLLDKPWLSDVLKMGLAALGVLLMVFGVLKPVMRRLAENSPPPTASTAMIPAGAGGEAMMAPAGMAGLNEAPMQLDQQQPQGQLPAPNNYEQQLSTVRTMVGQDPKRVAQVVKTWVGNDG